MDDISVINHENILKVVRSWPLYERLSLAQDILGTLAPELETSEPITSRPKRNTLEDALGLLATNQSAPSDQDIESWLDDYRVEKYTLSASRIISPD